MKSVYMICGLGGAGKSTYAKKIQQSLLEKYPNKKVVVCSVDEFRTWDYKGTPIEEAKQLMINKVKNSLEFFDFIIADFSFDGPKSRKWFLDNINFPYNINFNCIYLKMTPEKLQENILKRNPNFILDDEKNSKIKRLCQCQQQPTEEEFDFKEVNIEIITSFNPGTKVIF